MDKRPELTKHVSSQDFQAFYWLKNELVEFCRNEGLPSTGGKIELSKRIMHYLITGEKPIKSGAKRVKPTSRFDWSSETLSQTTEITDNYSNTENVRSFFRNEIGDQFKFNVRFMNWMKSNVGKTLADAVEEWKRLKLAASTDKRQKVIAPQFEYNTYLRDFLADNPTLKRDLGIRLWNIKKTMRGSNAYERKDLELLS